MTIRQFDFLFGSIKLKIFLTDGWTKRDGSDWHPQSEPSLWARSHFYFFKSILFSITSVPTAVLESTVYHAEVLL